jgi:hypothetical protein
VSNAQFAVARAAWLRYSTRHAVKYLTKEQQTVLCVIILLLLTGLAVKTWRTAHPPRENAATNTPAQKP